MQDEERDAWLRLKLTPGVGDATARKLLAAFGLPPALFAQPQAALGAVAGPALAQRLRAEPEGWHELCARTRAGLAEGEGRRHLLTLGDPGYPPELLQTEDPPLLLHVEGDLAALGHPLRLAIVGSRNPTAQGADHARAFARALASAGACIVSGLALGIDAAAHQGALEGGGRTLAVVGTGLDQVYPRKHQALARSREPRPMTRSMVNIRPTGASKKRKLRWCCACIRSLSPLTMPSRPYRPQPFSRRRSM